MMLDFKYRGLSDQQISAIKRDEKMMELLRDPKLFLGIRNGYFNLYFQGASTGKCSILDTGGLKIKTHCKYLGTGGNGYQTISQGDFPSRLDKILSSIQNHQKWLGGEESPTGIADGKQPECRFRLVLCRHGVHTAAAEQRRTMLWAL